MNQHDKWGQGLEREASSHHEAGHAVISVHIGLSVESVDIIRQNGDLGGCDGVLPPAAVATEVDSLLQGHEHGRAVDEAKISPASRAWIEQMIRSTHAGPLAERDRKIDFLKL